MTKLIVVVGFLVAFGAGAVVGIWRGIAPVQPSAAGHDRGSLQAELHLTAAQTEQMRKIWDAVRPGSPGQDDGRSDFRRQRDEAIEKLIRPEDRPEYERVLAEYTAKMNQSATDRRKAFEAARARTMEILSPDQRKQYEDLLRRHETERANRGAGRRSEDRATTRPSTK